MVRQPSSGYPYNNSHGEACRLMHAVFTDFAGYTQRDLELDPTSDVDEYLDRLQDCTDPTRRASRCEQMDVCVENLASRFTPRD